MLHTACQPVDKRGRRLSIGNSPSLFLTGVLGTGVAFVLNVVVQKSTGTITEPLLSLNISIFGVAGAALIPDAQGAVEPITPNKLLGAAVILARLVYAIIGSRKRVPHRE